MKPRMTFKVYFIQQPKMTVPPTCAVLWFYLAKYHFSSKSQLSSSSRAMLLPRSACLVHWSRAKNSWKAIFSCHIKRRYVMHNIAKYRRSHFVSLKVILYKSCGDVFYKFEILRLQRFIRFCINFQLRLQKRH